MDESGLAGETTLAFEPVPGRLSEQGTARCVATPAMYRMGESQPSSVVAPVLGAAVSLPTGRFTVAAALWSFMRLVDGLPPPTGANADAPLPDAPLLGVLAVHGVSGQSKGGGIPEGCTRYNAGCNTCSVVRPSLS